MTEKRFIMNEDGYIWDNEEPISQETVLNRLNALYEENEQLKKENNKLIVDYNGLNAEYEWLKEENEQLKANYNSLSHNYGLLYDECINKINALKKENEELKKENNNLKKALWEAEENYLYEAYYDNSARREDKLQNLKEDFKRGYWND